MRITNRRIGRCRSEGPFLVPDSFVTADVEQVGAEPPRFQACESPGRVPQTVRGVVRPSRGRRARGGAAPRDHGRTPGTRVRSRAGHVADRSPGPIILFEGCGVDDDGGARARAGGTPRREALA
jgi:hypothetical protein